MSLPIITTRLLLRNLSHNDIPDILEMLNHPSVARIVEMEANEQNIQEYIDMQNSFITFQEGKYYDLALEHRRESKVIGLIGLLCQPHKQAAIGWGLNFGFRGKGYATEGAKALISYAFSTLGMHRVYAKTSEPNSSSWKLMERLGMRREAHFQEAEFREGQWIDNLVYAVLAKDWLKGLHHE